MVTKAVGEMHLYEAAVYTGTAGLTAGTATGYVLEEDAVTLTFGAPGYGAIRVQGEKYPIRHTQPNRQTTIAVPWAQLQEDLFALALGLTKQGNQVWLGDSTDTVLCPQISLAIVGQDLAGDTVRFDARYASMTPAFQTQLSQVVPSKIDMATFEAEAGTSDATMPVLTFGDTEVTITAGGDFDRVYGAHYVVGAGAAADDLDTITAATGSAVLTNEETLRIRPSTIGYAVTLKHVADQLELFGAADYAMGSISLDEYIDLQYLVADTAWHEIGRWVPTS